MEYEVKRIKRFKYIEEGDGHPVILLHGLFGALSNWVDVVEKFKGKYKVVIPIMPIYELPLLSTNVRSLARYINRFIKLKGYRRFTLVGNSLGGHVALVYACQYPTEVHSMVLAGSSGLYENAMGGSFPRREDYNFIKSKVEYTFYDPKSATKELVDEVFEIVNNRTKLARILSLAKSAIRHNMATELHTIKIPTCLIWGKNDTITPPEVAEEFHKLIDDTELFFIDKCGHAPMMEQSHEFNNILEAWLDKRVTVK